uniref:Glutamine synthetase n=1 Tax=Leersia perrieri TaxID=77586 RepID=A0A0D9WAM6_9ORYZ
MKKRKRRGDEATAAFDRRVFPILLAAAATGARTTSGTQPGADSSTIAARLLRRLLSRSPSSLISPLPSSLVAVLPLLLASRSASVAALSCEVLGAAALQSMEASEVLASDAAIADGLGRALRNGRQRVAKAACNAIMDLSASAVGRGRLAGSAVLPSILKVGTLELKSDCINSKNQLQSREHEISEAIFRISMNTPYASHLEPGEIRRSIFGQWVSDYENFLLNCWEKSTYLHTRKHKNLEKDCVFASLLSEFDPKTPDTIIQSLVNGVVSCPAISSDELDISSFLHDVQGTLGAAVKYRQDIRVVRTCDQFDQTSRGYGVEEHFFDDGMTFQDSDAFVAECKDAFKNGFSVALRGVEFRSEKIASIASAMADLFGQPSVGANIYFSPPRSQGLARHYDDHCVLVWQLLGRKKWMVWPNAKLILPRLYEPFESLDDSVDDSSGRVEVLHEGDIMYVPRGFVHEAHTDIDVGEFHANSTADCSLHLTLAIEVEPPFEWEGFTHMALHCWTEKHQSYQFGKSKVEEQTSLFALLLHVAIRLLSRDDAIFRKACMVAAKLPLSSSCTTTHLEALRSNQRSVFDEIIKKIDKSCNFKEALTCIELAVEKGNDEPFQWMCWLRHLPRHEAADDKVDFCNILGALEELLDAVSCNLEQSFAEFTDFKSKFCGFVVYEDACIEQLGISTLGGCWHCMEDMKAVVPAMQCQVGVRGKAAVRARPAAAGVGGRVWGVRRSGRGMSGFKVMAVSTESTGVVTRLEQLLNMDTTPFTDKIIAEYIWVGGSGIDLRSKSRTISKPVEDPSELPKWNYDGSSTGQAPGEDSEVILYPQAIFKDPFRGGNHILVMCDTYTPAGEPIPTNKRNRAAQIFSDPKVVNQVPWFGIEQEYTLLQTSVNWPLGWPVGGYPGPQGPYYCAVGSDKSFGRDISDAHYKACLYAGINISGTNGEVMPGQWEYQVGPSVGIEAGDHIWMSRYILERITEQAGVVLTLDPKPIQGDWNGAGCHTNYSTKSMREDGGFEVIKKAILNLSLRHDLHISAYGEGNERRLTGLHETASIDNFSWGVANRGCSIRVGRDTEAKGKGYLEDRRPASNMDPYVVTALLAETTILWEPTLEAEALAAKKLALKFVSFA